ncbi:MAG: hypothetical protein K0S47_2875 [Herbinix sp.]|jgi:sucrose-6-phosphate hydrolase SacC (GH32 family)|nr:hypothetical protein [Herbinix sp.]
MKSIITKQYLKLPVNQEASKKKIEFYSNEQLVFDLDCRVDMINPRRFHYVDVRLLLGKEIELKISPNMEFQLEYVDEIPSEGVYQEVYRPQVHFTVKKGWINDPNGLFYANNTYHMFYQYNPASIEWDNMHWGHAISQDLIHWTELETALFPDELGTMFSGCAFVDTKNDSGLKENENDVILLYYTAAGNTSKLSFGKKFTQCLAYSTDNGLTFQKYDKNPVVPHLVGSNRDPKVVYSKELDQYVMALYLEESDYILLTSVNLLDWEQLHMVTLANDNECPDIYPLEVENEPGVIKWIISGASDRYLIGSMDSKKHCFMIQQESKAYRHGARVSYAAQTFDHTGNRRIKIAWESVRCPDSPFHSQMSVPCDVSLYHLRNEYYLRTNPVPELEALRYHEREMINVEINKDTPWAVSGIDKQALDIIFTMNENSDWFDLSIFGLKMKVDVRANRINIGDNKLPLSYTYHNKKLRVIVDTCGFELFADDGLIYTAENFICDYNLNSLSITTDSYAKMEEICVYTLKRIWY